MSKLFINRPIVAMVISILMVIVGAVRIARVPVAQFPNIVPTEIQLQATFPGADAKTLEQAVATPIEQQINGVDNMDYMYSLNATANSQTTVVADFEGKTDPNTELILAQSREQLATGQLPAGVNTLGVTIRKSVTAPLMLVSLSSPHGTHDAKFLANYAYINLNDPIARLYGVGQTQVFGAGKYAMRLWVKPDQLAKLGITVTEIVNAIQAQNKQRCHEDMDYTISLDQTAAVTEGMREIIQTLLIAIVLVLLVVYLFLQDWRATLIPMLAVPVSLVGTFILFPLFGFSINTLSMFGLVLAIGLVVDDAIVVVEGVQRHIEEGLAPKDAARKAMEELSGPVVAIALVLSSVFVPTAFIPGITGRLHQQLAVTIANSLLLSAFNPLTLSPALPALLLRPKRESHGPLRKFFDGFNRMFGRGTEIYVRLCGGVLRKGVLALVVIAAFGIGAGFFSRRLPSSFLPDEDQGYVYINMDLPNAASLERTSAAARQVEQIPANTPGVQYTTSIVGFSLLSFVRTTYNGFFFVTLKPWSDRKTRAEQYQEIKVRLNQQLSKLPQGTAFSFSPPAIPGVGTSGGFQFVLEDRAGRDVPFLAGNLDKFLASARNRPAIGVLSTSFLPSVPQKFLEVHPEKALKQDAALNDLYTTIHAF